MRGFEQVASKPRCDLMQFHRLVKLKLVTVGKIAQHAVFILILTALPLSDKDVSFYFLGKEEPGT